MFLRKIFYMASVDRNQWLPIEKLQKLQLLKFKKIINYAYNNSKFYKDKFTRAGIQPQDIKHKEDILRIPFTTKREVLENFPYSLLAKGYKLPNCHIESTSGSSGLKLTVAFDYKAKDFCDCVYGRALFAIGYKPWQPMAYFWPYCRHRKEFHEYLGLMKKNWISSDMKAEDQLEILLRLKPKIIYCFPSILIVMAKIIENSRSRYSFLKPELIVSHAELLTEESREYIEHIFGCSVYNEYGATEFGFRMAWECKERKGLHIDIDSVLIEFLRDGDPVKTGEKGEMVITGLVNYAMPLIRYQIGDIGTLSARKCACGRGLPLVEAIEGRKDDFIKLPSGKIVSPRALTPLIRKYKEVIEFKVVQKAKDRIYVYIVSSGVLPIDTVSKIKESLLGIINENVDIFIERVGELSRTERGKLQTVISEVNDK
ncbi:MAG: hypothetical protein KJ710_01970 [Candidatus Omnitrophica bacterium]|nr:hypothetical protein [Candidatus Omnitrophota bacterium]MBU1923018.1 hypothetical protein [Candidatus Omnitrophota bacterium]